MSDATVYGLVARAVRKGILVKQPCVDCGSPVTVAHHEDYSKPLDVIWLCQKHHLQRHRIGKEMPKQVSVPMKECLFIKIDEWRYANQVPTRVEAIRRLIEIALNTPATPRRTPK